MSARGGQVAAGAVLDAGLQDVDGAPVTLREQLTGAGPLVVVFVRHFG